ncbi:hypothetical protein [Microtetraspora sp. NBRC 16547]|uniref:hypothetical protein n=1 Tax=Microtetraspora sp. NBRC 16547 TaxID=3030993 RepID=UPI0024A0F55B|nr:hypothetical protein [Microtetraspora sp. NBRC 16547]GLX02223.1 hypothetical protein Misp02_63090 [Microtetraspora sp. NBRC 16547]
MRPVGIDVSRSRPSGGPHAAARTPRAVTGRTPLARTAVAALLTALLGLLLLALPTPANAERARAGQTHTRQVNAQQPNPQQANPQQANTGRAGPTGRVVVIGVPGLLWSDLDQTRTPNLWRLTGEGSSASLSARVIPPSGRSVTCPVGGWLTVSAGQRAGAAGSDCAPPPVPEVAADGSATVPGWDGFVAYQRAQSYGGQIGLLGSTIAAAGGKVAAIGPGAALGAADTSGKVQKYAATSEELPDLTPYTAVFAEAGEITRAAFADRADRAADRPDRPGHPDRTPSDLTGQARRDAVAAADRTVGDVLRNVPPGSTILVAGLADSGIGPGDAHLHVAIATTAPGDASGTAAQPYARGFLTATSTQQDALVTITDLTATVLHAVAVEPPQGVVGRAWQRAGDAPTDTGEIVTGLADTDLASQVLREIRQPFFITLVAVQVLFYGLAAVVIRRHRRMLTTTQVVAVVSGAIPVSTFLAQLVPWWTMAHPMAALIGTILGFAGAIAALAFAGPWRAHVAGPLTVVAAVSSLALLIDVMTGSMLQVNAVTGYEPVTGGRFYGFGNMAFAIFATGTILALAGLAQMIGRRPVLLAYGLLAIVADGWPGWGADFGGVPAFVVGFAVFALLLYGHRVSIGRLAAVGLVGAVLIAAIAVVDWLRPAGQRTHLGAFVQQVADGQGASVIGRKLGAMLNTLGNTELTLLSVVAIAFLFLVLSRPSRWGASALTLAYGQAPALRAGLFGALTTAMTGFLINDSGIAIPAMALTVAVPLTLAASVRALQLAPPTTPGRPSAPAAATAPPAP